MEFRFTFAKHKLTIRLQLIAALLLGWAGMALVKAFGITGGVEYIAAFLALTLFALMNTMVSLAHPSFLKYTVPSYYGYIALVVVLLLSAKFLSGISIWTLFEYRMSLMAISIFYVVSSLVIRAIRLVGDLFEQD